MKNLFLLSIALLIISCTNPDRSREIITTDKAPAAIGPYSQAVKFGNNIFVSGQLGINPETGKLAEGFEAQVRQALDNAKAILEEGGFKLENVVRCQVFLVDMSNYKSFNEIYKEYFLDNFPARAVVEVSELPAGGLVEVMLEAKK